MSAKTQRFEQNLGDDVTTTIYPQTDGSTEVHLTTTTPGGVTTHVEYFTNPVDCNNEVNAEIKNGTITLPSALQ